MFHEVRRRFEVVPDNEAYGHGNARLCSERRATSEYHYVASPAYDVKLQEGAASALQRLAGARDQADPEDGHAVLDGGQQLQNAPPHAMGMVERSCHAIF